jgi:HNH endonuclease
VNASVLRQVWRRAARRCEYCHLPSSCYPWPLHVDHVIARQHGGQTVLENLALACLHCNLHKGPNIAGRDPASGKLIALFHPRQDQWRDHFEWSGAELTGRTITGAVTVRLLAINDPDFLVVREALLAEGVFPLDDG